MNPPALGIILLMNKLTISSFYKNPPYKPAFAKHWLSVPEVMLDEQHDIPANLIFRSTALFN